MDCGLGIGDSFNNATKKRCAYIWIVVMLSLCAPLLVWAFASEPPLGRTGAPGDFGTCAACHSGGSGGVNNNVTIAFSGGGTTYTPGAPQTLTVTVNDHNSTTKAWGFEMTAVEGSVANTPGTFAAVSTNVYVPPTSSIPPNLAGKLYAEHQSDSTNTFVVTWTPPAGSVYNGPVVFYVASNAGDGVRGQADSVYTANYTLTLPNLAVTPSALTFNYQIGGTTPPAQSVSVSSSGTVLSYMVTSSTNSGGNWLSATPTSGTTGGGESVSVNPTGLAAGTYTGSVSVASTSAGNSPRTVAVTLNVTPKPNLTVTPGTLTFNYQIGGATPTAQGVSVGSSGTALSYAVTSSTNSGGNWLSATPASGTTAGSESVSVNPTGLAAGTYTGSISVASTSAGNSPQTVAVTVNITSPPPPNLTVTPGTLTFNYQLGGTTPAAQSVSVGSGGTALSYMVTSSTNSGGNWLSATPVSGGPTPGSESVSVNPTGLAAGTYTGSVSVSSTSAGNSPQTVSVTLNVTTAAKVNFSGTWQIGLRGTTGCGFVSMLAKLTLNSSGSGTGSLQTHGQCGDSTLSGQTFAINSLAADGSGTAGLSCGTGCGWNFKIQVAPDHSKFNLTDVSDPGNFLEGTGILGSSGGNIAMADLTGTWQVMLYGQGGCGIGTTLATFTLGSSGTSNNVTETGHTVGCGDSTTTGNTFTINSLNPDGSGTAGLSCGASCGFNFSIQVSSDRSVFNLVDVSDANNFLAGTAVSSSSVVYNTLTNCGDSCLGDYQSQGGQFLGARFVPSAPVNLTSLTGDWQIEPVNNPTGPPTTTTVSLWTDSGGEPAMQLESWSVSLSGFSRNNNLAAVGSPLLLRSGQTYWVLLSTPASTVGFWDFFPNAPTGGGWIGSSPNSLSNEFGNFQVPALEVQGTGNMAPADLIGTWQLAIYGQGGCGIASTLVTFTLNSSGVATNATETSHSAGCGDTSSSGNTFAIQSLSADGSGTAGLSCGAGCGFNYKIQVSPDRSMFSVVDVSDPGNFQIGTAIHRFSQTSGDFDGDGQADTAVWRPSNGTWYVIPSSAPTTFTATQWGVSGDAPVPGDYDGDGKTDKAVWRPSTGTWYIIPTSAPTTFTATQWGVSGDIPVPGDYDGDGKTDIAVWRPSTGTWYILPSSKPGTFIAVQWGVSGDMPVPGDYDGDGKTDMAVWRPSNGTWYIIPTSAPTTFTATQWGVSGDAPVPGDYDGDGKTDKAIWRPSNGTWYVIPTSAPTTFIATQWGVSGDIPVPRDYDGDGKTDKAVWRPSLGTWYIIPSSAPRTFTSTQWGISTDVPVQKPSGQ